MCKPTCRMVRPAFTLVESAAGGVAVLLVMTVLAAATRTTRDRDKLAGCLANMRAIGQASRAYAAEDPKEILIPVPVTRVLYRASGFIEWGGKAGVGQPATANDPTQSPFGTGSYRGPAHRPLNRQLYKAAFVDYNPVDGTPNPGAGNMNYFMDTKLDLDIYRCPADTGYAGGGYEYTASSLPERNETRFKEEGKTAYDHYGNSYQANVFWAVGGLAGQRLRSQSVYLTPLSRVPSPSLTIAYLETPARYVWCWGDWSTSGCDDYGGRVLKPYAEVQGWHGEPFHFNVTFADGHAALVEMKGCIRPPPNLGAPNYPAGDCAASTPPYDCERCVTIRGPEWQLDTLPTPAVLTPYYAD
jgi:hypothetical protein